MIVSIVEAYKEYKNWPSGYTIIHHRDIVWRNKNISTKDLKNNSNILIEVECRHMRRMIKFCSRTNKCTYCLQELNAYTSCKPGRKITWGEKISKAKKGVPLSQEGDRSIKEARKIKFCKKNNISIDNFCGYPCSKDNLRIREFFSKAIRQKTITLSNQEMNDKIQEQIGYSLLDAKRHLERYFLSGMSWQNRGKKGWEIDHIIPISSFDERVHIPGTETFRKAWALDNIRPIWYWQNCRKNNQYSGNFKWPGFCIIVGEIDILPSKIKDIDKLLKRQWKNEDFLVIYTTPDKAGIIIDRHNIYYKIGLIMPELFDIDIEVEYIAFYNETKKAEDLIVDTRAFFDE